MTRTRKNKHKISTRLAHGEFGPCCHLTGQHRTLYGKFQAVLIGGKPVGRKIMFYTYIEEYSTETMPSGHEADVVSIRECHEYDSLDFAMENFMNMVKYYDELGYKKNLYRNGIDYHVEEIFGTHTIVKHHMLYPFATYGNLCEDKFSIRISEEKPHDMVYHSYVDYPWYED